MSFAAHSIRQYGTVLRIRCQLDSNLSGEAMASKVLKKKNAKLKFLHRQSRYLIPAYKRLFENLAIFRLWMFPMVSSFKEKLKTQTSKSSKQIYSLLPKFTSKISY